jgi:adenosylmethionine-8-amino-7-oxononanoate aminotransferase
MAAGLATLRELDDAQLVDRAARLGDLLLERTRTSRAAHDVVRDVRGTRPDVGDGVRRSPTSGSLSWRVMERMQTGLFAQLVVVPLSRGTTSSRRSPATTCRC